MLTIETSKLVNQLKQLQEEIENKLEGMVQKWTVDVSEYVIAGTPIGSYEKYGWLYDMRDELEPIPGLSRGSWQVSLDGDLIFKNVYNGDLAVSDIAGDIARYRLGQTYYIGNTTPYVEQLEGNGRTPQLEIGGFQRLQNEAVSAYNLNLKTYYDRSGS